MQGGLFLRLQIDAVRSGMIADMGAELWQTLCVLASFMDENGECYPTQEYLAEILGISREAVNRRIVRLRNYRWRGNPIITSERLRDPSRKYWTKTVYKIYPASGISFGSKILCDE